MLMDMLKDIYRFLKSQGWECKPVWLGLSWMKTKQVAEVNSFIQIERIDYFRCAIKLTWTGWKCYIRDKEVDKQSFIDYIGYEPFGMCPDAGFLRHILDLEDQAYRDSDRGYLAAKEIIQYIQSHWHEYK